MKKMITAIMAAVMLISEAFATMAGTDIADFNRIGKSQYSVVNEEGVFGVPEDGNIESVFGEGVERDESFDMLPEDHEHIHCENNRPDMECDCNKGGEIGNVYELRGDIRMGDDGYMYFIPSDNKSDDSISDDEIEEDSNGSGIFGDDIEPDEYDRDTLTTYFEGYNRNKVKLIYYSSKAGSLMEDGSWVSPSYKKVGVSEYLFKYYNHRDGDMDIIGYIKDRLQVDDIRQADPEEVDYLISFVLPLCDGGNCTYSEFYGETYVENIKEELKKKKYWTCPLCGEVFRVEPDFAEYGQVLNGSDGMYICSHFNYCQLRDEDRYWTCDDCGKKYEINKSILLDYVYFKNCDEAGALSIDEHKNWCTDRENMTYHCDMCGKDYYYSVVATNLN